MSILKADLRAMVICANSCVKDLNASISYSSHYQVALVAILARHCCLLEALLILCFENVSLRQILVNSIELCIDIPLTHRTIEA